MRCPGSLVEKRQNAERNPMRHQGNSQYTVSEQIAPDHLRPFIRTQLFPGDRLAPLECLNTDRQFIPCHHSFLQTVVPYTGCSFNNPTTYSFITKKHKTDICLHQSHCALRNTTKHSIQIFRAHGVDLLAEDVKR